MPVDDFGTGLDLRLRVPSVSLAQFLGQPHASLVDLGSQGHFFSAERFDHLAEFLNLLFGQVEVGNEIGVAGQDRASAHNQTQDGYHGNQYGLLIPHFFPP